MKVPTKPGAIQTSGGRSASGLVLARSLRWSRNDNAISKPLSDGFSQLDFAEIVENRD